MLRRGLCGGKCTFHLCLLDKSHFLAKIEK